MVSVIREEGLRTIGGIDIVGWDGWLVRLGGWITRSRRRALVDERADDHPPYVPLVDRLPEGDPVPTLAKQLMDRWRHEGWERRDLASLEAIEAFERKYGAMLPPPIRDEVCARSSVDCYMITPDRRCSRWRRRDPRLGCCLATRLGLLPLPPPLLVSMRCWCSGSMVGEPVSR